MATPKSPIRLYHLTSEKWGQVVLADRRLKYSRFDDLNDPFELLSAHLGQRDVREFHKAMKAEVDKRYGLLCLSKTWRSPVMWAHYADKHRGLCLGFDVKEAARVDYTPARLKHVIDETKSGLRTIVDLTKVALVTKFEEWKYEKEWRLFRDFRDEKPEPNGFFYQPFNNHIALREVLIGYRCPLTPEQVAQLVGTPVHDVTIIKVRPSFQEFKMVRQKLVAERIIKGREPNDGALDSEGQGRPL